MSDPLPMDSPQLVSYFSPSLTPPKSTPRYGPQVHLSQTLQCTQRVSRDSPQLMGWTSG